MIDPANDLDEVTDLYIEAGAICAIGAPPKDFEIEAEISAENKLVCPGLVDLSVRLREPGDEHKATVASETRAAASSGVTTVCCPPDTKPVLDTPAIAELIHQRAEQAGLAKVICLGALTQGLRGERLAEMCALKEIGCIGVSNALSPVFDTEVMRRAMEYAATCGLKVFLHPQDYWLGRQGHMHDGEFSARLGIPSIPETAETVAVSRDLLLIEQTGVRAHFGRLSTARAVEMVNQARTRGLPITADVSIHHLLLTHEAVGYFGSMSHVIPPFRTPRDRDALRQALASGHINAICSDHQPHDVDAKTAPFSVTEPGISSLESLVPLALCLISEGHLDLKTAIAALTINPAKILGIQAGTLSLGSAADICILDRERTWVLEEATMLSAGKNSPFLGQTLQGKVTQTLLNGKLVYEA